MKFELQSLLDELKAAYSVSDIRKSSEESGQHWYYSLVTTSLEPNAPLIIGFNWGAAKGEEYKPQEDIVEQNFTMADLGSLKRAIPFFEKYVGLKTLQKASQTNYCLFRSKNEGQISQKDIDLSKPIFEKLIHILRPSALYCFSSKLRDYLLMNKMLYDIKSQDIYFSRGGKTVTCKVVKAKFGENINIYFLPHPNYPMKAEARLSAWEFCLKV